LLPFKERIILLSPKEIEKRLDIECLKEYEKNGNAKGKNIINVFL